LQWSRTSSIKRSWLKRAPGSNITLSWISDLEKQIQSIIFWAQYPSPLVPASESLMMPTWNFAGCRGTTDFRPSWKFDWVLRWRCFEKLKEFGGLIDSLLFQKDCQEMWDPCKVHFHKAKLVFQNRLDYLVMNPQSGCNGFLCEIWLVLDQIFDTCLVFRVGRPTRPWRESSPVFRSAKSWVHHCTVGSEIASMSWTPVFGTWFGYCWFLWAKRCLSQIIWNHGLEKTMGFRFWFEIDAETQRRRDAEDRFEMFRFCGKAQILIRWPLLDRHHNRPHSVSYSFLNSYPRLGMEMRSWPVICCQSSNSIRKCFCLFVPFIVLFDKSSWVQKIPSVSSGSNYCSNSIGGD
jgi:hypothetical protein